MVLINNYVSYKIIKIFDNEIAILNLHKRIGHLHFIQKIIYDNRENENRFVYEKFGIKYMEISIFNILINNISLIKNNKLNNDILTKTILYNLIKISKKRYDNTKKYLYKTKLNNVLSEIILNYISIIKKID